MGITTSALSEVIALLGDDVNGDLDAIEGLCFDLVGVLHAFAEKIGGKQFGAAFRANVKIPQQSIRIYETLSRPVATRKVNEMDMSGKDKASVD